MSDEAAGRPTARELGQASMAAVEAGDRDGWLALFSDDAVVEDPVGPSMFDPEGKGHRGPEAIAAFYDNVIGVNESIRFDIRQSFQCGDEVANVGTIRINFAGGRCDRGRRRLLLPQDAPTASWQASGPSGRPTRSAASSSRRCSDTAAGRPGLRRTFRGARSADPGSQAVNPYCSWAPITAHSNMP